MYTWVMTRLAIHSHHSRSRSRQSVTVTAEVIKAVTSARCDADLTDAPSRATYTASKSRSRASKQSESNRVTGTPGKCIAKSSSIDISSSLLSCASTCVSGTNMIDVCVNRSNEHARAPVRARACIERAAATSRGKTRGNSSRNRDEKPFQAVATAFIVYSNFQHFI